MDHRSYTTSRQNRANRKAGADFESILDGYHEELLLRGLARVMRTNPQVRMTGPKSAIVTGKGECDNVAFLASGWVVHFDSKSRAGDAFSYAGRDVEHQQEWLRAMAAFGHGAGLLVWWSDYQECRWHPVESFEKRVRRIDGELCNSVEWLPVVEGKREREQQRQRERTIEDVLARLTALLDSFGDRIVEIEGHAATGVQGVHPAFFSGQIDILVTACVHLEALVEDREVEDRELEEVDGI
jgi:hypothetical protein